MNNDPGQLDPFDAMDEGLYKATIARLQDDNAKLRQDLADSHEKNYHKLVAEWQKFAEGSVRRIVLLNRMQFVCKVLLFIAVLCGLWSTFNVVTLHNMRRHPIPCVAVRP